MKLPPAFQFSQSSLQDFVDCPRRFQLRYILRLAWPALQSQPVLENERLARLGEAFHRMAQQYLLGVPPERLQAMLHDPDLARWQQNFLRFTAAFPPLQAAGSQIYPEISLSAPLGAHRLLAKFDLVIARPGEGFWILDWKTSQRPPRRRWLAERMQTLLYPYLLARAGAHFNRGAPPPAEQIEMVYWFANAPADIERFPYSPAAYREAEDGLSGLIARIEGLGEAEFPLTGDDRRCAYCPYRSLCDRGVEAGALQEELESLPPEEIEIDFEQIAEIEY
ncbi:MAG: PD-(D/E)XK nuclease family protein [Chloroflexi bacterium]|nr:PD-(D/E)XK nuclease family protein [Chloroflexota bacterium]